MDSFLKIKKQYQQKKILILGLGIQGGGLAAVDFFHQLGSSIRVSDIKDKQKLKESIKQLAKYNDVQFEFGSHSEQAVSWADVIVRNPGVPINSPTMILARQLHKEIVMPSAFFLQNCPVQSIGITGTRGKSTTTNMIYQILKQNLGPNVYLAGNLPQYSAFKLIPIIKPQDRVVFELSSWELQGCCEIAISPPIAVLTNLYPDHLNYYDSFQDYIDDKMQIFSHQKAQDYFITLRSTYSQYKPIISKYLKSQLVLVDENYFSGTFKYLLGQHNYENASLALKVGEILGIEKTKIIPTIQDFQSLPHRLELLGTLKSAQVYNDSTSTTPIAGIRALEALSAKFPNKKLILVAGGNEKKLPYDEWLNKVNHIPAQVFLLPGSFTDLVKAKIKTGKKALAADLKDLFVKLIPLLNQDTLVLFSPSATSFATFKNEFDRGDQFCHWFKYFRDQYGA